MEIKENELLVIIDPQKDFINLEGDYSKRHSGIKQILDVRRKINHLISSVNKDRIVIVYSDYKTDQFGTNHSMCIPGTWGHEIDLEIDSSYILIPKTRHSCFSSDQFTEYLHTNKIKKLILCGFLAEYCVKQTAIDGLVLGYHITLLKEYIATGDDVQLRIQQTLLDLSEKGAEINNHDLA